MSGPKPRTETRPKAEHCDRCERELDRYGNCPKHWPIDYEKVVKVRTQGTVGRLSTKTSLADDLLVLLESDLASTVTRLLDGLAGLAAATSAGKAKQLDVRRTRNHQPLPGFEPAWADRIQRSVDDRLWELSEELLSFLNRPTDPRSWAQCDNCGNKRIGESVYCQTCGSRILEGARRCRQDGCPNQGRRRSGCPADVAHV